MEEESHPGSPSIFAGQSNRVSWTLNGLHFIQLPPCWGWACTLCAALLHASAYGLGHIRFLPAGFFKRLVDAEAPRPLPRRDPPHPPRAPPPHSPLPHHTHQPIAHPPPPQ